MRELAVKETRALADPVAVRGRRSDLLRYLHATAGNAAVARLVGTHGTTPVQRLVVNVGEHPLATEIAEPSGWLVAKAIDVALAHGGGDQKVVELDALKAIGDPPLGTAENVYLVGHGEPGKVGDKEPQDVAAALGRCLPAQYSGEIRSLSCSSGIGGSDVTPDAERRRSSAVAVLAEHLKRPGVRVYGPYGDAFHHPVLDRGFRTVRPSVSDTLEELIADDQNKIDAEWGTYVASVAAENRLDKATFKHATTVSTGLYEKVKGESFEQYLVTEGAATVAEFVAENAVRAEAAPSSYSFLR